MRTHRSQARATAYEQWGHDQRRKASPLDDDSRETRERIERIEAALPSAAERDLRLLVAELQRLKGRRETP